MRKCFIILLLLCTLSCSGEKVVVDNLISLKDGEFYAFKLEKGKYILELTSANGGVVVDWIGGLQSNQDHPQETNEVYSFCEIYNNGQLIVKNPTTFGTGSTVTVTIKLTKTNKKGLL